MADQAGLKQTRSTIPENTFLCDGANIKCTLYELDKPKNIIKIAQETGILVPVWRPSKVSLYIDIVFLFLHLLVLWECRAQHLFESRVALNSGLGGVKNVASAIISNEWTQ